MPICKWRASYAKSRSKQSDGTFGSFRSVCVWSMCKAHSCLPGQKGVLELQVSKSWDTVINYWNGKAKPTHGEAVTCTSSPEKCPAVSFPKPEGSRCALLSDVFIKKPLLRALQAMADTLWLLKSINSFWHPKWQQDPVLCDKPVLMIPCPGMRG